jgi:hypothetical protein
MIGPRYKYRRRSVGARHLLTPGALAPGVVQLGRSGARVDRSTCEAERCDRAVCGASVPVENYAEVANAQAPAIVRDRSGH